MNNRELKHFHAENRTHIIKKKYSGPKIIAKNTVNAPYDYLKIYGASAQTEGDGGRIYPSSEITLKCTDGEKVNSIKIPFIGYAMEVSDIAKSNLNACGKYFLADYIEYSLRSNKAYRHRFIDDTLLDHSLPMKDQLQAILSEPIVEEITMSDEEYSFQSISSIQNKCVMSAESYSTDGLPHPNPMFFEATVKKIAYDSGETRPTYDELSNCTYNELYIAIPKGEF